ncbi:GDSL-type esterase/lipase family protein [Vibrio artabrorum]|uniref:GDSL-type esterase/lipase family protein n=1 Tax=Vibrio artabrorum TaxID=446374 RepID=UPI00354DBC70
MKIKPQIKKDDTFLAKHQSFLSIPDKNIIDVVFLGDSLTRRWEEVPDLWDKYFSKYHPLNLGIGGDHIEHVMWRVENGELDHFEPQVIILQIGTNNLPHNPSNRSIVTGILDLITQIKQKNTAHIVVIGLYPRAPDDYINDYQSRIEDVNHLLSKYSSKLQYHYEYFGDIFIMPDGSINKNLMPDGLHLNYDGYQIAGSMIAEIINNLITSNT